MHKIVILSGAGISAESGIATFRDSNGLWEQHHVEDVAHPKGWEKDPALVLRFYNERRAQARLCSPNQGHITLADAEAEFDIQIVTQNVDSLHEVAGSTNVLHLHGNLFESRSTCDPDLIYPVEGDINIGDHCKRGYQLRPNIVWFEEMVPNMKLATDLAWGAEAFIVVGTSLNVYPAAGILNYLQFGVPVYVIDPNTPYIYLPDNAINVINEPATTGVAKAFEMIREYFKNK